jgi:hypothetical protein
MAKSKVSKSHHGQQSLDTGAEGKASVATQSTKALQADVLVEGGGSVYIFRPLSDVAREWIDTHIGEDNGYQPYYPSVVVEHRYIADLVQGAIADGLVVR